MLLMSLFQEKERELSAKTRERTADARPAVTKREPD